MRKNNNHKVLITTGCLLWIVSFFGEGAAYQPFSTIGIVVSPILTILGLFFWFRFYKSTRGYYPKFWMTFKENNRKMCKNPFEGFEFMFKHILETWTGVILFWMTSSLIIFLTFGQSESFQATKEYCKNNKEILSKTGTIKYFGLMVSGSISTNRDDGNANFSFLIIGTNGNFLANAELTKINNKWTVDNLTVRKKEMLLPFIYKKKPI
jgi:hypothetical protein